MIELFCVAFEDHNMADRLVNALAALPDRSPADLQNTCVLLCDSSRRIRLKQVVTLAHMAPVSGGPWGALWGTLIGALLEHPAVGLLPPRQGGAAGTATFDIVSDYGVSPDFLRALGGVVRSGSSMLFVLVRNTPDGENLLVELKLLLEVGKYGGTLLRTTLKNNKVNPWIVDS